MCDASPGLCTPIRGGCRLSRYGILVPGTADDPISVRSTPSVCGSHRLAQPGEHNWMPESSGKTDGAGCAMPAGASSAHMATPTCTVDEDSSGFPGCVDWGTISTDEDDNAMMDAMLASPSPASANARGRDAASLEWFRYESSSAKRACTPLPCTPAKKPITSLRMRPSFARGSDSAIAGGSEHRPGASDAPGVTAKVARTIADAGLVMVGSPAVPAVVAPTVAISLLPSWKPYRHKVLLRLRKKQARNNYDLALFLLLKFGGPDSNAGRSVLRDGPLLECSALSRFRDSGELQAFYTRHRAALVAILSQRTALNSLSSSQLHRKLAKLLPPSRWFNRLKLEQKVAEQEVWNPFSIFGSALPYVSVTEVFGTRPRAGELNKAIDDIAKLGTSGTAGTSGNGRSDAQPTDQPHANRSHSITATPGINWSGDPLVLDEVLWYLEATGKYVDKSRQVCTLQRCFCVTPNPQIAFNWNDARSAAWRRYRGPRASMGLALSPSTFSESLRDYEKLRSELQPTPPFLWAGNNGVPCTSPEPSDAATCAAIGFAQATYGIDSVGPAVSLGLSSAARSAASVAAGSCCRSSAVALTPQARRVKMQQLTYYCNYFKANGTTAPDA
ncbi:uncharacterized protein BcabD6B2_37990 [Babesia caballi]|uniref:Uncharacterized protein n=1 Tax=Babesia caballi TaxID=5871 RepID=A0AAV4M0P3_BABCB|nr:hypothetical protein, conserved [Babesia caballi]